MNDDNKFYMFEIQERNFYEDVKRVCGKEKSRNIPN